MFEELTGDLHILVSTQLILGSRTNGYVVPLAGLKMLMEFSSLLPT